MLKIIFTLLSILLIKDCFQLIESRYLKPNLKKRDNSILDFDNAKSIKDKSSKFNNLRSIKKRSPKLNGFFEDSKPINGNTDYIDFTNAYKDEVVEKLDKVDQTRLENRKRRLDDEGKVKNELKKRKKRKRRKQNKANRFKRKDNPGKFKRASSGFNKFNLNNNDQIEEQRHIISLQSEDHFKHLILSDKNSSIDDLKNLNLSKFKQPINDRLKFNQTDQNEELNKILDKIVNEKVSLLLRFLHDIKFNKMFINNTINTSSQFLLVLSVYYFFFIPIYQLIMLFISKFFLIDKINFQSTNEHFYFPSPSRLIDRQTRKQQIKTIILIKIMNQMIKMENQIISVIYICKYEHLKT